MGGRQLNTAASPLTHRRVPFKVPKGTSGPCLTVLLEEHPNPQSPGNTEDAVPIALRYI